jgi:hypothetical protein
MAWQAIFSSSLPDELEKKYIDCSLEELSEMLGTNKIQNAPNFLLLPLHAGLLTVAQLAVFEPAPLNTRIVIISSTVAEASVTMEGLTFVACCRFVKVCDRLSSPLPNLGTKLTNRSYQIRIFNPHLTFNTNNPPDLSRIPHPMRRSCRPYISRLLLQTLPTNRLSHPPTYFSGPTLH